MLNKFKENERLAGIYYAYHAIHRYLEEPFTSYMPEALFNIARFLMTEIHQHRPKGISLLYPLFIKNTLNKAFLLIKLVPFGIHLQNKLEN